MTTDRRRNTGRTSVSRQQASAVRPATNRQLGLEGRHALPTQLRSLTGSTRRGVLVGFPLAAGLAVAILVVGAVLVAAAPPGVGGIVELVVVALLAGVAMAGFTAYATGRVFLVRDARTFPGPSWEHDGILLRHSGPDPEPLTPDVVAPLASAADAAAVRTAWGIVIGWTQCVFGAAAFLVVVLGMVVGGGVPWILAVVTFIIGGLGQDMAARSTRTLGRVAQVRRSLDGWTASSTPSAVRDAESESESEERGPASALALRGAASAPALRRVSSAGRAAGKASGTASGSGSRTARRMPPRAPGRGSSLELPGE